MATSGVSYEAGGVSERERSIFIAKPEEIDLERHLVAIYLVESNLPLREAGVQIAAEESVGTWTELTTLTPWAAETLPAKVFKWRGRRKGMVSIAFPMALFDLEKGGMPNVLSIVAGNLFGLAALRNVRLMDLEFPKAMVQAFPGPQFGIDWIREHSGTLDCRRPHLGTIVKPKVGLDPKQTAQVVYEAAVGGVDFIKDDETLSNQGFCPLDERTSAVMEVLDRARSETGREVFYAVNVTSNVGSLLEMAETAKSHGANMLMIDVLTAGFSAVQMLAEDVSIRLPLHVHRTMHAALTRNPRHGIHPLVLMKLVRLVGGDQMHTGTGAGKMEKAVAEVKRSAEFLRQPWFGLRNVFPVASGGVHPGIVSPNLDVLGRDCVINAGGGIHGHPDGTRSGATAMRQAIDAYMQGIPVEEYSKSHEELRVALATWGDRYAMEET